MDLTFGACLGDFDRVIEESRRRGDRVGLFAAMYREVTAAVRARCEAGGFEQAPRMEHFVVSFAGRYFVAHDAWRAGRCAVTSWVVALDAATRWRPLVLQHLLLGMNAHINLDLGAVTAELAGSSERLGELRADFDAVNDVLGTMVDVSQDALSSASPWFGLADRLGARSDETVIRFSLRRARAQAWALAERLVALPPEEREGEILRTDQAVAAIARRVLRPGLPLTAGLAVVRIREPWSAASALAAMERAANPSSP